MKINTTDAKQPSPVEKKPGWFRALMQKLLNRPVMKLAERVSSAPDRKDVFLSLSALQQDILAGKRERGIVLPLHVDTDRYIILSDQHKGAKDLADDFRLAEENYLAALTHYYSNGFTLVALGDCEELWENKPQTAIDKNRVTLLEEAKFLQAGRYYRIFGNHDLEWKYEFQQKLFLKPIFGNSLKVYEGIILQTTYNDKPHSIFLAHGHQGDKRSDGNPFSMWVVAAIWTPIQRYLNVTINTISDSIELVDRHNIIMYEWSDTQTGTVFISGHTHKPVFASMDHIDRLNKQLEKAKAAGNATLIKSIETELEKRKLEYAGKKLVKTMVHPSYFNSGCCCFSDGDITGIEIADGFIRLIKWKSGDKGSTRIVLEESPLFYIFDQL